MVGKGQIVIDCLGDADHLHLIARSLRGQICLMGGIHRIVPTVIEKVADIIFFKQCDQGVLILGLYFVTATEQARPGGMPQAGNRGGLLLF